MGAPAAAAKQPGEGRGTTSNHGEGRGTTSNHGEGRGTTSNHGEGCGTTSNHGEGHGNTSNHDMSILMELFVYYLFESFVGLESIHALHLHTHSGWVGK